MKKQLIKCGKFAFIDVSKAEGLLIQPSFEDYAIVRLTYNDEVSTANIYKVETKELLIQFILELDETCISDSISLPSVTDFIEWFDEERDNFITMLMEEDNDDVADTERK